MVVVNEIEGGVIGMDRKILQELANEIVEIIKNDYLSEKG